jgi:hypothetical protein
MQSLLFLGRTIPAFPAVKGGSNERKMAFNEHLFDHLEPLVFMKQFD